MIRINLLLTKKSKGTAVSLRLGLPSYVIFVIIAIVAVILIEGYTWYWLNSTKSYLTNEKRTLEVRLSELKEKDGKINISGAGMTNDDIVKYVNNLKSSRIFQNVQLTESRQVMESGIPVYNFNLVFNINLESV